MIYDTSQDLDKKRALERFKFLIDNQKTFEITEKKPRRSISQNSYLHLLLSWFGCEFGYTLEEVKQIIFKQEVNSDVFYIGEKEGLVKVSRWRSSADLDTSEMTLCIDRFRDYSAKNGCYLPEPGDMALINEMEREISKHKQYL